MSQAKKQKLDAKYLIEIAQNINESDTESEMDITQLLEQARQQQKLSEIQLLANEIKCTMLEIAQIKERNKERRHKELMMLLRDHLSAVPASQDIPANILSTNTIKSTSAHNTDNAPIEDSETGRLVEHCVEHTDVVVEYITNETTELVENNSKTTQVIQPNPEIVELDLKNEYRQMRLKILEIQKQKMADRERKSHQLKQQQNSN